MLLIKKNQNAKLKFADIPAFRRCNYVVFSDWDMLERTLEHYSEIGLDLNPDFQRGHVWSKEQKTAYIEFCLLGGSSGRDIYFNCLGWMEDFRGPFVLVDGKQRIMAVREFLKSEVPIFGGHLFNEFEDSMSMFEASFLFHINNLSSREDLLRWYLALNTGGTIHTAEEISKVKVLLEAEIKK